ncbi:hypothetical protein HF329_06320 [Chitinophaga oryzae]|uniref:WG repeat-containing protein n=1 Tax=Chitinophaga oryzae TaxID=2725414 RepID=A0AAE6ZFJ1_9BACT|nr:hypothetical protein [Chitinophaga oryzae]QJB30937.1 hypothetical protein HF329_06320 [Chitinophaga oryzae]
MKKLAVMAVLLAAGMYYAPTTQAQVRVNVNLNVGSQPLWGPVGYDYAEYYYLPDVDAWYYIPRRQFIFFDRDEGDWVFASALPRHYQYDLYRGYKVVVNEPRPYLNAGYYRNRYGRYRGWYDRQDLIRDCHDDRYRRYRDHDDDDDDDDRRWRGRGRGRGHGHGHGHGDDD